MTLVRSGLAAGALLCAIVLLDAPCVLAKGHGHGHPVSIHVPPDTSGKSKHGHVLGAPTHEKAPSHAGPPPYSLDEDGHLVSHGVNEDGVSVHGGGDHSSGGGGREGD